MIYPTAASLLISEDCNLRCKYCFELGHHNKQLMSKEVARDAIKFLFDNAKKEREINHNNVNNVSVILFGGEPLLNPDGIETVLETGEKLSKETGISFQAGTITNGTIMNDKIKRIYKKYRDTCGLSVQLSVDGIKEAHDMNRVTIGGKGSFDMIMKNLDDWKEIFEGKEYNICVHTCLSQSNMKYFYDSWKYFMEEWKLQNIWFMPIHSDEYTIDDVRSYKEQLIKIGELLLNNTLRTGDLGWIKTFAPLDKCIMNLQNFSHAPCGAGKNFCSITAKGLVSPCHQVYYNDEENFTIIGNIYDGIDSMKAKLLNEYDSSDLSCNKENPECDCYGCYRCLADNWCRTKNLFACVRKERCMMSHIERDMQQWMKKELIKHGFLNERGEVIYNGPKQ